jgi:manganese transport protein
VHSTLTRNKLVDRTVEEKKRFLTLHTRESIFCFTIAGMVNAAILIVSAVTFFPKFSDVSAVDEAYRIMIPIYGSLAAIVFAVTLLFSGLAS